MHRIRFGIIALCSGTLLAADVECTWTAEKPDVPLHGTAVMCYLPSDADYSR